VKKPPKPEGAKKPEVYLPYDTKIFKAFPRLTAFLADQWYDDGEPRTRGSIWVDSEGSFFKALLKEPSLCLCARVRAATLDDLFKACEVFLGLESPPWEVDEYAQERARKKGKK